MNMADAMRVAVCAYLGSGAGGQRYAQRPAQSPEQVARAGWCVRSYSARYDFSQLIIMRLTRLALQSQAVGPC